ncbi:MAG: hypothetical protein P4L51_15960 [Puia sp.]|nr:hypothetical protein [Puia sp.]
MKTSINSNSTNGNSIDDTPSPRFVHIHAEAVNARIHKAFGKDGKKKPSAGTRMKPAHFFAGPHCVFFAR